MNIQSTVKVCAVAASVFALFLAQPAEAADGKNAYKKYCQACHQPAGKGMAGVFPPLADNPNIKDKPDYIAKTILQGKSGSISVNGTTYNGSMPPMSYLKDADVAAIANYVNTKLANGSSTIEASAVAGSR